MSLDETTAVFAKELREILRDRRSLFSGLFYGVWGPLVMGLALVALARTHADETIRISAAGSSRAPALVAFLESRGVKIEPLSEAPRSVVQRRIAPVVLEIEESYERAVAESRPARVSIFFDGAWSASARAATRVRSMLTEYAQQVHDARLVGRGILPEAVRPLRILDRDVSTAAGRAATVLGTLPIFLLLSLFIGGMSVAADMTAGERERGSLESLLVHAAPRSALVVGKWAAVTVVTLMTMVVTIVMARVVLAVPRVQSMDLPLGLSGAEGIAIAATLLPLSAAAVAVQLLLALRTNSYKEAQTQLTYLMFVPMVPGFLLAFGSVEVAGWMRVTPIIGQHLFVADLLRGEPRVDSHAAALAAVTVATAVVALAATTWLLGRESILRRQAP